MQSVAQRTVPARRRRQRQVRNRLADLVALRRHRRPAERRHRIFLNRDGELQLCGVPVLIRRGQRVHGPGTLDRRRARHRPSRRLKLQPARKGRLQSVAQRTVPACRRRQHQVRNRLADLIALRRHRRPAERRHRAGPHRNGEREHPLVPILIRGRQRIHGPSASGRWRAGNDPGQGVERQAGRQAGSQAVRQRPIASYRRRQGQLVDHEADPIKLRWHRPEKTGGQVAPYAKRESQFGAIAVDVHGRQRVPDGLLGHGRHAGDGSRGRIECQARRQGRRQTVDHGRVAARCHRQDQGPGILPEHEALRPYGLGERQLRIRQDFDQEVNGVPVAILVLHHQSVAGLAHGSRRRARNHASRWIEIQPIGRGGRQRVRQRSVAAIRPRQFEGANRRIHAEALGRHGRTAERRA